MKKKDVVYIDDYAHHPRELSALIGSAKKLFSGFHCTVIFQPHLFSRTRDLAYDFARSLDEADNIVVLPIYPAREQPIDGVTAETITGKMKNSHVSILSKQEIEGYIKKKFVARNSNSRELVITAGAGDIDTLVEPIGELLNAAS